MGVSSRTAAIEETAEVLGLSTETVKRDWRMAKAWLIAELAGKKNPPGIERRLSRPGGAQ